MKKIIIVGAGGFGRELLQWIKDINAIDNCWNILGFIDDNLNALDGKDCDISIIGTIKDYVPDDDTYLVMGIAAPNIKRIVGQLLLERGAKFASIIHPTAMVSEFVELGVGFVAYPHVTVGANVKLGDFVTIGNHSGIGHDAVIGDYVTCFSFCDITGGVKVGEGVTMGSSVSIVPGRKIGKDSYLCAGCVIMTNVREKQKMIGNPAKMADF